MGNWQRVDTVRYLNFDMESRPGFWWYGDKNTATISAISSAYEDDPYGTIETTLVADVSSPGELFAPLLRRMYPEQGRSPIMAGHNITRFDMPLLNAGLLRAGLPILRPILVSDSLTHFVKKHDMPASLEYMLERFDVRDDRDERIHKTHVGLAAWEDFTYNPWNPDVQEIVRKRVSTDVINQVWLRRYLLQNGLISSPKMWFPGGGEPYNDHAH